jgi:hypothetical protein
MRRQFFPGQFCSLPAIIDFVLWYPILAKGEARQIIWSVNLAKGKAFLA